MLVQILEIAAVFLALIGLLYYVNNVLYYKWMTPEEVQKHKEAERMYRESEKQRKAKDKEIKRLHKIALKGGQHDLQDL
jgi:hypothetical protein